MSALLAVTKPTIDWFGASPILVLFGAAVVVLLLGLASSRGVRHTLVPLLTVLSFAAAGVMLVLGGWDGNREVFHLGSGAALSGTIVIDQLSALIGVLVCIAGVAAVLMSLRSAAPHEAAHGEYYALLLASVGGMVVFVSAQELVTFFLGLELLSIPLYVLCATEMRRARSLESGLKYLIIGSLGSATMLYGLALLYGAAGSTWFYEISAATVRGSHDTLVLAGVALAVVGLAFKASVAPFHQWTPDVYEGAPTPVTAFMAVATKAATFGAALRLLDVAVVDAQQMWGPLLAALATITIVVGNVGALGQDSLKRLLAWSSVAQAGYLLAGVLVATRFGVQATLFYLAGYLALNLAAFAVVVVRERESGLGDSTEALRGLGRERPLLAWPLTIAMLGLAGMPATVGFVGKVALIGAAADGGYIWLGVVIVLGSVVSLAYYLRVVAAMWTQSGTGDEQAEAAERAPGNAAPRLAGADPEAEKAGVEVIALAVVAAAAGIVFGVLPGPLMSLAATAARALSIG